MTTLKPGDKAPVFKGIDQNGKEISLKDFNGKKVVLYFYPKDSTPGCTAEACNLRDNYQVLLSNGLAIVGVSVDSQASHQKFIEKFDLPFPLIADTEKVIVNRYGVWGEKKLYGRAYMGTHRVTFIISEKGIIEKVIDKVKTGDHSNQILKEISTK